MVAYRHLMEALLRREELGAEDAEAVLSAVLAGEWTDPQVAGFLIALQAKGPTGGELAAFARILRRQAVAVPVSPDGLVDTCGTGGGRPSFNLSTAAAFIAAGTGARVAKHGNRAVTSRCGSADVLEALGAGLSPDPEVLARQLDGVGVAFLFAPHHHPSLKAVGPIRKALEVRTVFNQLGPLANPCGVRRQVVGVYDPAILRPMAEALALLGVDRALVVHGRDGMDEVSPCSPSFGFRIESGGIEEWSYDPPEPADSSCLEAGDTPMENAAILREALSDAASPRFRAAQPCSAAALWAAGLAGDMAEGMHLARQTVERGAAAAKLNEFLEVSRAE